ncbi:hypothetical protein EHQ68_16600 [Leptospira congkakensis]|uniref:SMP-30/Gluconolactonase/LRE-like region domain-containing protein n=1 Tax=Leptospira congkakensis TaxID=2484932 RepID=A0A4Z1A7E3_9LEPT|nr:NHL repeat-containing protein [Leptospira congkakensis]TGL86904.1 hypothetical protein EHQ68_16600 [Leptospira congkakensis]TGL93552.1 hypothetical protein EHQ69_03430 [Leptospira congkakensis]TGL95040.1 hypothetical protein EHQ70_17365 [Leptospira congkakensis]
MKIICKLFTIALPIFIFLTIGCQPKDLGNNCDPKSDSYFETLVFQALSTAVSYHCGFNLVNIPPFGYRHSNYRLYLDFPVSIVPRYPMNSSYSIQGVLPAGLTFDTRTGEISGTTKAITAPTNLTITKNSPGFGIVSITLQVVDTIPTFVYGQYGYYTCANTYNNGSCAPGSVTNQNFSFPYGVVADSSGGVYISGVNRIQYFPPKTTASTRVYGQFGNFTCDTANMLSGGSCSGGAISENSLNSVRGLALDDSEGLYAVDTASNRVLYFPRNSNTPTRVYGQSNFTTGTAGTTSATSLYSPLSVHAAPDGGVYISESGNIRVLYFPPNSTVATRVYGQPDFSDNVPGNSNVKMTGPYGITMDSEGGLFVVDSGNNRVLYFPAGSTTATRVFGQPDFITVTSGSLATNLNNPNWVALDQSENLYVADTGNNRVLIYPKSTASAGIAAVAVLGQFNSLTCNLANNDGTCTTAGVISAKSLSSPSGIYFNQFGQLYIADRGNNRVLAF